jgi:hypothetical protein
MRIEMVSLPIFGDGVERAKSETASDFIMIVEEEVREILGEMSDKEYLARRATAGTMPHLNCVFEEPGIHHEEHKVLPKVLKLLEDKARKTTTKNTTTMAEAKKRKGIVHVKTVSKKRRVGLPPLLPPSAPVRRWHKCS